MQNKMKQKKEEAHNPSLWLLWKKIRSLIPHQTLNRCSDPVLFTLLACGTASGLLNIRWKQTTQHPAGTQRLRMTVTSGGVDSWCYNYITNESLAEGQRVLTSHLATDPLENDWEWLAHAEHNLSKYLYDFQCLPTQGKAIHNDHKIINEGV